MICQHFLVVLFCFCCAASAAASTSAAAATVAVLVVAAEAPATKFEARVIYCQCAHFSLGLTVCRQDTPEPVAAAEAEAATVAEAAFAFMLKLSNCASFHCRLKCTAARAVWNASFALFARHNPQQSERESVGQLVSALS